MSTDVSARIRRMIETNGGSITFAAFMEEALYGPGGFYEDSPVGRQGHFVTSPHVHPLFGRLVASALRDMWGLLGRPDPFELMEIGGGDGTLAEELLEALAGVPVEYIAVERSPGARARLSELPVRVESTLEDRVGPACVIGNELLDNLPFRRVRNVGGEMQEVRIGVLADRFVEFEAPCDAELARLCPRLRAGEGAAVPTGALDLIDRLAITMSRGYALLIDYGEATGRGAGDVHGYRAHRVLDDVLAEPGSADITAGVDFSVLMERANARGLATFGPVTQLAALESLGFAAWIEQERGRQAELLDAGAGLDAVRAWGGRSRATLLVDPAGLGRLQWLVIATPGLPQPSWLRAAMRMP